MTIIHDPIQHSIVSLNEEQFEVGKLSYHYLSDKIIDVFSTRVLKEYQGKGIAGELYNALIDFVQQQGLRVKPSCSYIEKRMLRSHPDLIA